jgi:hypothetical protein
LLLGRWESLRERDCYQFLVLCLVGVQVNLLTLKMKLETSLIDILDHGNVAPGLAEAFIVQKYGLNDFSPLQLALCRWVQQLKVDHSILRRIIGCMSFALLFFLLLYPRVF